MAGTNSTNQVPTSAANQQASTPGASMSGMPAPNYGQASGGIPYTPSYTPPAMTYDGGASLGSGGGQAGPQFSPPPAAPASNPFSEQPPPQASPQTAPQTHIVPPQPQPGAPNPFTAAAPTATAPTAAWAPPPGPHTVPTGLPTAGGAYTHAVPGQPGIFVNDQGYESPESNAFFQQAFGLWDYARDHGYRPDSRPAVAQYASGLLDPYKQGFQAQ